jgi:hypothetical protein
MRRLYLSSLLLIAIAGCQSFSDPDGLDCGAFSGRASGAATDSLTGCAFFATQASTGTFVMVLTNGGPSSTSHMLKVFNNGRPAPGTHVVGTPGLTGAIWLYDRQFLLSSGSMVVIASDTMGVAGTVDLTGADVDGVTVSVTGEFKANCTYVSPGLSREDQVRPPATPCSPGLGQAARIP